MKKDRFENLAMNYEELAFEIKKVQEIDNIKLQQSVFREAKKKLIILKILQF